MKKSFFLFCLLGLSLAFHSCTKDDSQIPPENLSAPTIPSAELFAIPVESFGNFTDGEIATTRNNKSNWIHAGVNVLVWNTVVFVNTAIPIAAFGHSFNFESEYVGNLTWQWEYEYETLPAQGSKKYDVTLTGQYIGNNEQVAWKMTVQEEGTSTDFVWYEGIVNTDHTGGTFTVFRNPESPESYVRLAFTRDLTTSDVSVTFTNIIPNAPGNGDYIYWQTETGSEYDRHYDVSTDGNLLEIEANHLNKNGRVKDVKHFGDENWRCWDTAQKNIDC